MSEKEKKRECPCDNPQCATCELIDRCGGCLISMNEDPDEQRICDNSCPHFDELNMCCWQAGEWGLCFDVEEGDLCHLGYLENDGK